VLTTNLVAGGRPPNGYGAYQGGDLRSRFLLAFFRVDEENRVMCEKSHSNRLFLMLQRR
jgi:hypothetical protein